VQDTQRLWLLVTHALIEVERYPVKTADAKTAIDLIRELTR
jgi:hypothetical protein